MLRVYPDRRTPDVLKAFTQHPDAVGETYLEHLAQAWRFAGLLAAAAVACLLHGLLPFAFQTSGSRRVRDLHERMAARRTHGISA
jgi:hypothetical protein